MEDAISIILRQALPLPKEHVQGGVLAILDWPGSSPALKDVSFVLDAHARGLCIYCQSDKHFGVHCPDQAPPNYLRLEAELAKVKAELALNQKLQEEEAAKFREVAAENFRLRAQFAEVALPLAANIEAGLETAIAGVVEAAAAARVQGEDDGREAEERAGEIHATRDEWMRRDPKFPEAALRQFLESNDLLATKEGQSYVRLREFAILSGAASATRQHKPHRGTHEKEDGTAVDFRQSTDKGQERLKASQWVQKVKARNPGAVLVELTASGAGQTPIAGQTKVAGPKGMAIADFIKIFAEPSADAESE